MSTFNLTGKNIIVTGGAGGIGLGIAEMMNKMGAKVIVTDRDDAKLAEVNQKFKGEIVCKKHDLSDFPSYEPFINSLVEEFGKIDGVVNNAGIHHKKPTLEVTDEEFERVININQKAVFAFSREASKAMAKTGGGAILNISSMASQYGIPLVIAYTAAKSAVEGMTRALAVELAQYKIRVNCIAPGFIKTNMSGSALDNDPERKAKVFSRTPMGYLGEVDDIGNAAIFLLSEASKYITGVILPVDGGNSIGF